MSDQQSYGAVAKLFHWTTVAILAVQYCIGWLMPDIHHDMKPGAAMTLHISFGITILLLAIFRLVWRIMHPVAPDSALSVWQRVASGGVHWALHALVIATTLTGWLFASFRGWAISYFFMIPLPMLTSESSSAAKAVDGNHQVLVTALLVAIGVHVVAALVHVVVHRDRVMQRMLFVR